MPNLKDAPLVNTKIPIFTLVVNVRLVWKGLPGTNTLAYFTYSSWTKKKGL